MKKILREGESYPRWYGISYIDFERNEAICYPFPINHIIGFARFLWINCRNCRLSTTKEMKCREQLQSLIKYCREHPDERLWQAIRNWSEYNFIYGSIKKVDERVEDLIGLEDTFYKD